MSHLFCLSINETFNNPGYTWCRWFSHGRIFISLKCLLSAWTRCKETYASTRQTGSTKRLDLPSSRFWLPPSLLNEQQEQSFSISNSLHGVAPSLKDIRHSQTVGNCQLTKVFSQQLRQGGRWGAEEEAGGGKGGGLWGHVWFVLFSARRQMQKKSESEAHDHSKKEC